MTAGCKQILPDSLVQMHKSGAVGGLKAVIALTKVQLIVFLKLKLILNPYSMGIRIEKSWTKRNVSPGSDEEWVRPTKNTCVTVMWWQFKLTFYVLGTWFFKNLLLKIALHTSSSIRVVRDCLWQMGGWRTVCHPTLSLCFLRARIS